MVGNLPVNWPKLLRLIQNVFTPLFDMHMFRMSFYITSGASRIFFFIVFYINIMLLS